MCTAHLHILLEHSSCKMSHTTNEPLQGSKQPPLGILLKSGLHPFDINASRTKHRLGCSKLPSTRTPLESRVCSVIVCQPDISIDLVNATGVIPGSLLEKSRVETPCNPTGLA